MIPHVFRLRPKTDLKKEILAYAKTHNIRAGAILTCVGSLSTATIRMADDMRVMTFNQGFEIVSLVGTVEADDCHLHICISDRDGKTIGGHLKDGCLIHTTAEVVIGEIEEYVFERKEDEETGFRELEVRKV